MEASQFKEYLLDSFKKKYSKKDYYDRFVSLFFVFGIVAVACQIYSGWSEQSFLAHNIVYQLPQEHILWVSLLLVILYEVVKSAVFSKFLTEFYSGYGINMFFGVLALVWSVGSFYMSYNGVDNRAEESLPAPTDSKTTQVKEIFSPQIQEIDLKIGSIRSKYYWCATHNSTHKSCPDARYRLPYLEDYYGKSPKKDSLQISSLEAQKWQIQEAMNTQLGAALSVYQKEVLSHSERLSQQKTRYQYNVVFTEIMYWVSVFFTAYFGYRAQKESVGDDEHDNRDADNVKKLSISPKHDNRDSIGFRFGGETVSGEKNSLHDNRPPEHAQPTVQNITVIEGKGFKITCQCCGKQVIKKSAKAIFCSDLCRWKYHQKNDVA